jgi:RNA polymerase sigma-B factor
MLSDALPRWEGAERLTDSYGMEVRVLRRDGVLILQVRGEVDRDTAGRLRTGLRHAVAIAGADRLVVDLAAVPLMDAAGVAVLLDAVTAAHAAQVELAVTGAQPFVARVLSVSGMPMLTGRG